MFICHTEGTRCPKRSNFFKRWLKYELKIVYKCCTWHFMVEKQLFRFLMFALYQQVQKLTLKRHQIVFSEII